MNIYRSALSASVIMGLPNVRDYIHQHRDRLMEEKRQKLLLLETQRTVQTRTIHNSQMQAVLNQDINNNNNNSVNIAPNNNT